MCRVVVLLFALLYAIALSIFLIGTFGLFGQEQDALSVVYLVILGLPWMELVDFIPEASRPLAAALLPAANLVILMLLCRLSRRRRHRRVR